MFETIIHLRISGIHHWTRFETPWTIVDTVINYATTTDKQRRQERIDAGYLLYSMALGLGFKPPGKDSPPISLIRIAPMTFQAMRDQTAIDTNPDKARLIVNTLDAIRDVLKAFPYGPGSGLTDEQNRTLANLRTQLERIDPPENK